MSREDLTSKNAKVRFVRIACACAALAVCASLIALSSRGRASQTDDSATERRPVLVELFTSEGCSSCPPADELLKKLDRAQPVTGAQIIALSEHVDYWDDQGWRDPFSSHTYTERQDGYAERFRLNTVYTPQMVVDGRLETVGSNEGAAQREIQSAAMTEKSAVSIARIHADGNRALAVHLEASALPASADTDSADVLLALADESDRSSVHAGENDGRTLTHVAVLRALVRVGNVRKTIGFSGDVKISPASGGAALERPERVVAIVQVPTGRVWGVAEGRWEPNQN